mgnify:CR=1 FL=1
MSELETIAKGRFISLVRRGTWEFVTRHSAKGVVIVVPLTDEGKLIFVEQFRPPVNRTVIEFPAGLAGDIAGQQDEALAQAAARELEEEAGYRAENLQHVYTGPSSAVLCDEVSSIFVARGLTRVSAGGGVDGEEITTHEIPVAEAHPWLESRQREGHYVAARVYTGLYFLER